MGRIFAPLAGATAVVVLLARAGDRGHDRRRLAVGRADTDGHRADRRHGRLDPLGRDRQAARRLRLRRGGVQVHAATPSLRHDRGDRPDRDEDHDRRPGRRRQVPLQDPDDRPPARRPGRLQRHGRRRVAERHRRPSTSRRTGSAIPSTCSRTATPTSAISAQRVGVNSLRGWDAGRYGDLDVSARDGGGVETITNDALSYDIYGAGIKALLDGGTGVDPLGNLPKPDTVIATGESQSGSRLSTYYNKVQPIHELVDAFLLTVSTAHDPRRRPEPMIRVLSETENRIPRTEPDAANYRQWEVAGGSHLPRMAFENFQAPIERDTRHDPLRHLREVPALAGAVAVRRQLGLRAPRRLGQRRRRRRRSRRAASTRTPPAGSEQPARARRPRHRPGRRSGCPR